LVDTSVLIDFLKGVDNTKTELFEKVINQDYPYGLAPYTYQELLQGARDEVEYTKLKDYLSTQRLYFLPESVETYEKAASMYFLLRRQGITVRSSIDVLIALTAIENDLLLLHNDRDYDAMAGKMPALRILQQL
jgi:hypothetical protein